MSADLYSVSAAELPYYLLERGLLDRESVVDGDLTVADASRRQRNLKVLRRRGPSYFVKQARDAAGDTAASLHREAVCYELAARTPGLEGWRELLPTYHGYDPERRLLVLGLEAGRESAASRIGPWGPDAATAAAAGRVLGRFHRAAVGLGDALPPAAFPGRTPWVLAAHRVPDEWMPGAGPAQRHLLARLRADPRAHRGLDGVAAAWRGEHLIHGDVKWDNLLLTAGEAGPECQLVDWELADLGDPAWDLGALLQGLVCGHVHHATAQGAAGGDARAWAAVVAAAGHLVAGYADGRGLDAAGLAGLLPRAVHLGGGRAVQSAYEMLYEGEAVAAGAASAAGTPHPWAAVADAVLGHALAMMEDPAAWARALFPGLLSPGQGTGAGERHA